MIQLKQNFLLNRGETLVLFLVGEAAELCLRDMQPGLGRHRVVGGCGNRHVSRIADHTYTAKVIFVLGIDLREIWEMAMGLEDDNLSIGL